MVGKLKEIQHQTNVNKQVQISVSTLWRQIKTAKTDESSKEIFSESF